MFSRHIAAALLAFGLVLPQTSWAGRVRLSPYRDLLNVKKVLGLVLDQYVEEGLAEREQLLQGAIQGMLAKLEDPYTRYMPPEGFESMQTETRGKFGGLGILIGLRNQRLTVIAPIPSTPASRAGIRAGDLVLTVEGKSTKGMTVQDAVQLLRGPKGSAVEIGVGRQGERQLLKYKIVRDEIKVSSVRSKMLTPTLGYAQITSFIQTTGADLEKALDEMREKYSLEGLVLDLRNNPGGLLTASLDVGRLFLRDSTIVSIKGRKSGEITYRAEAQAKNDFPIVVLINRGSASASEIVAGAIKDNQRGVLMGQRSFGKGSVQTVLPLHGGSALALTTAYYYTPSGVCIHKKGIHPDIEVALPRMTDADIIEFRDQREKELEVGSKKEFLEVPRLDSQLQRAKDLLESYQVMTAQSVDAPGMVSDLAQDEAEAPAPTVPKQAGNELKGKSSDF